MSVQLSFDTGYGYVKGTGYPKGTVVAEVIGSAYLRLRNVHNNAVILPKTIASDFVDGTGTAIGNQTAVKTFLSTNFREASTGGGLATIVIKTASYSLTSSDTGKVIVFNSGSAVTCTVPVGLPAGFSVTIIQKGIGQVSLASPLAVTITNRQLFTKTAGQGSVCSLISDVADNYYSSGDMI